MALTRAKDELDLVVPQRFFTHQQAKLGDRHLYASRSRFIPGSILGSFATRDWRDPTDGPIELAKKSAASVDIAASLMDVAISKANAALGKKVALEIPCTTGPTS